MPCDQTRVVGAGADGAAPRRGHLDVIVSAAFWLAGGQGVSGQETSLLQTQG